MKQFRLDEDIPEELCEKYHDILGISNFKTEYAHKALNAQLELEIRGYSYIEFNIKENTDEISKPTTGSG